MQLLGRIRLFGCLVVLFAALIVGVAQSDPLASYSDEFSANSLGSWQLLDKVLGTPAPYVKLDIDSSRRGYLTIEPASSVWYMNQRGTMLFKNVTGNFIVSAYIVVHSRNGSGPPTGTFNSAGVIARDPASTSGHENWLVCNVGMQQTGTGSEAKVTVNSQSQLRLSPGPCEGEVRLARVGNLFTMLRKLKGESQWTNLGSISRADMGQTLQVGIMCNGFQTPDCIAEVDYVRFGTPSSAEDITRDLARAGPASAP